VFIGVRVSGSDGEAFHIDAAFLQFLDGMLGLIVCVIDGYYRICNDHKSSPCSSVD
jgi:hypothetical protein